MNKSKGVHWRRYKKWNFATTVYTRSENKEGREYTRGICPPAYIHEHS